MPPGGGAPWLRLTGGQSGESPRQPESDGSTDAPTDSRQLVHELANLLDGSLRNVSLALRRVEQADGAGDDNVLEHLRTSEVSLKQMGALINCWRMGSGLERLSGQSAEVTLTSMVEHVMKVLGPVAETRGVTLDVSVDPAVENVHLPMLQPVLMNGLRNAIEAIEEGGRVELTAATAGDDVEVRIADDGPGVDPALSRDRDGLVSAGVSTKSSGQGLGLAISRDLVRAMSGTIRLEDNADAGRGAVLVIRLPAWSQTR